VRVGDGRTSVYTITPGSLVTVPIQVIGAVNLGAATIVLAYDPAVVQPSSCSRPLSSAFDGGMCNLTFAPDAVRFNVVATPGVSGDATMAEVVFRGVGGSAGAMRSELRPTVVHFADLAGNSLPVNTANGAIRLSGSPPAAQVLLRVGTVAQQTFVITPGLSTEIPLSLQISDTARLGAASVALRYAPTIVRPTQCRIADGLQGYCNYNFDPQGGLVKFSLLAEAGLTGILRPFSVTFEAVSGVTAGASELALIVENLADANGTPLSWQAVNGKITVVQGYANSARLLVGGPGETGIYTVTHGATVTASVWVTDVTGLGAATLSLGYDPAVVRALACQVRDDTAGIDGGSCALGADRVRANIISSRGLSGAARLWDVAFTSAPGMSAGVTSPLTLTVENLADTTARPLPSRVRNGWIEIKSGGVGQIALLRVGNVSSGGVFTLPQDDRLVVPIRVEGAVRLGAASLSLAYNPAVVRPVSCTAVYSGFDGGLCNPGAGDGLARLNLASTSGFTGTASLFELAFQPVDGVTVGAQTPLTLTAANFADPGGRALLYQVVNGRITITGPVGTPQVVLGISNRQVAVGQQVAVSVTATINAAQSPLGLGATTLVLGYDPASVQPVACTINQDLAANGFQGGACNLRFAPGQIKFNALSMTGVRRQTIIAEIVFQAVGRQGDLAPLTLQVDHLADTASNALTHRTVGGAIQILPLPPIEVRPDEWFNDTTTSVEIFGFNFRPDSQVRLMTSPFIVLPVTFIDSRHLAAKTPAGLTPGVYDLVVDNGGGDAATLIHAFTVINAVRADDLRAQPYSLWTNPTQPLAGQPIRLGLTVERIGGVNPLSQVPVRFYQDALSGPAIGDGYLGSIGPDDTMSTAAVDWGIHPPGDYVIWAAIDPDNQVAETNEANNVISRTVSVWPSPADTTPPVTTGFLVDGGAENTSSRAITLSVTAIDNVAPVRVHYVEQHYNQGSRAWIPVQQTDWLPYGQVHQWTLHPDSGLRYLQAWVADAEGNISQSPLEAQINYLPALDQVAVGEVKVYRQSLTANQCLTVRIDLPSGDPDLYIWPPNYRNGDTYWYSINGPDQVEQIRFAAPTSGNYQIEIEGADRTAAMYRMVVQVSESCPSQIAEDNSHPAAKTPRVYPLVPVTGQPPTFYSVPSAPTGPVPSLKGETTTVISTSPDLSLFGEVVSLTATVTVNSPAAGTPTGVVTFIPCQRVTGA
jgi:hypothetical protein